MTEVGETTVAPPRVVPSPSCMDKLKRFAWMAVQATLYRWSPVTLHGWRSLLLRAFGARIRGPVHVYPTAKIWAPWNLELAPQSCIGPRVNCYSVARVTLEQNALVSQGAHLCTATHDFRVPTFPLVVAPIRIRENAWVAAEAFLGPGVEIADRAVVGARAVVTKSVPPGIVVAGNPARQIGTR